MRATGPVPSLEARIARLLTIGTYSAVALIAVGVVLMAVTGHAPLDVGPAFDPGRLAADLTSLQPAGFLWIGVLVVLATPLARVMAALAAYLQAGEREMALVAVLILTVVVAGVLAGTAGG